MISVPNIRISLVAKVAASLLLLGLVLLKVDFSALGTILASSNWLLILLGTVVAYGAWFLNTWKWQILLASPGAHLSYWQLLRLNFLGIFYNLILPGQVGGEVVKGITLSNMGVTKAASAVSIMADRVTGLLAIFILGIAGLALAPSGALKPASYCRGYWGSGSLSLSRQLCWLRGGARRRCFPQAR